MVCVRSVACGLAVDFKGGDTVTGYTDLEEGPDSIWDRKFE